MNRFIPLTLIVFCLASISLPSCNARTDMSHIIADADSVAINFFAGEGKADSVSKVWMIRDKETLKSLSGFFTSSTQKKLCGYDGNLNVFKMDQVQYRIDFSYYDASCMRFSYVYNDKLQHIKLSEEAKHFLESLEKQ